MTLCERRILALYQRLWRENRLLLELLRGGYTLAEAEKALGNGPQSPGLRDEGRSKRQELQLTAPLPWR